MSAPGVSCDEANEIQCCETDEEDLTLNIFKKRCRDEKEDSEEEWNTVSRDAKRKQKGQKLNINNEIKTQVCITYKNKLPKQFALAKLCKANAVEGITRVKYINPFKILFEFEKDTQVEEFINNNEIKKLGWRIQKTWEVGVSYGMVQDIELDISVDELLDNISSDVDITSVKRLNRRAEDSTWVPSEKIRIGFIGSRLPPYIFLHHMRIRVDPFVFPVTQCSKCWRFGHLGRMCPSNRIRCPKCGENHDNCERTSFKCCNCNGNHLSLSRSCPVYIKEKKIRQLMSDFNCSYRRALTLYVSPSPPPTCKTLEKISKDTEVITKYVEATIPNTEIEKRNISENNLPKDIPEKIKKPKKKKKTKLIRDDNQELEMIWSESESVLSNDTKLGDGNKDDGSNQNEPFPKWQEHLKDLFDKLRAAMFNDSCENIRLSSERISRALAAEKSRSGRAVTPSLRSPRCKISDGEFEEIQCDNEIISSCWCVDTAGFEVPGTRAPAAGLVNCSRSAPCAAHTCRMLCPLGFELDPRGCPLCKCRDPCSTVTCPGQLSCQLEETPCLRPPCPPVPTCKRGRSLQNICPVGEPLLISETRRPFLCGTDPGKPNCPPLYRCLVESGNDYGVCCPASLELQKAGTCPAPSSSELDCGTPCSHDLECPSMQKCCDGGECGRHCILPHNVTMCTQQKMLAELLVVSEREGRGYVPQCTSDGSFLSKQCSRNGLVCWCVDTEGNKLRGSMAPAASVHCSLTPHQARSGARSLSSCARALCAGVCEYGYKSGTDGCPTCECDDPCAGFPCPEGEECVRVRDAECSGELCTGYPVCRPKISYDNPCSVGVPATDERGALMTCGEGLACGEGHACTHAGRRAPAVCCPDTDDDADNTTDAELLEINFESCVPEAEALCGVNATTSCTDGVCEDGLECCSTAGCGPVCVDEDKLRLQTDRVDDTPSMCEYLRDFDEKMEGTVDGMKLALPGPTCKTDGSFTSQQCANGRCWCVDSFGTEIPQTSTKNASAVDCDKVRSELSCLELTCRMGCDYGFELGKGRCPTCTCRDPCAGVSCPTGRACALVDVACDADYCPPVPACLPRKSGQCPYLVPWTGSCEWSCRSDAECGGEARCCATGCGTACAPPVRHTRCQHTRALALHTAAESGNPPSWSWVPRCKDDGSFESVQCRGSTNICWCVDDVGNEIPGTRSTNSTPNCTAPAQCPDPGCDEEEICPHGRELNDKGCPSCTCKDPCAEAKCREDESCELVPLECEGDSCPPLARCSPSPQCPSGEPLLAPGGGALPCGPRAAACPSTHACRFAPHDAKPAVCCPKPRSVCMESKDEGPCLGSGLNTTRWHFNPAKNRCERFQYQGCSGNHNNFRTKDECNAVCPVLSPCERLREKNEAVALKYGKGTFVPACDVTGAWQSVQCMTHIDVCWCVNARGEPQKGSLLRGGKPTCNFRQARKWLPRDPLDEKARADEVLEELIRQMTASRVDDFEEQDDIDAIELEAEHRGGDDLQDVSSEDSSVLSEVITPKLAETIRKIQPVVVTPVTETAILKTKCQLIQEEVDNGGEGYRPRCLPDGSFAARQCARARCRCVDAAGRTRHDTVQTDRCEITQVESALLELEVTGTDGVGKETQILLTSKLTALGAHVPVTLTSDKGVVTLRAVLPGPRAADVVYHIETQVKKEKLSSDKSSGVNLGAAVIRSEYRLAPRALQREILSESTVSAATSYHTALIVLAATSAFIISVLCVLVMLYRARLQREPHKAERFLPPAPPVYVLSADEKAELARALHAPPLPVPPVPSDERV